MFFLKPSHLCAQGLPTVKHPHSTFMEKHLLLLEDDVSLSQSIRLFLQNNGFRVTPVYDGQIALRMVEREEVDACLIDVNVPGLNGLEVCRQLRLKRPNLPLLMITALGDIDTKMEAFGYGADDFLVKPFHLKELLAKLHVFIKRSETKPRLEAEMRVDDLVLIPDKKQVHRAGLAVELTPKEYTLLEYLVRNKGRVISKEELIREVWNDDFSVSKNVIEVYISFLRNKIDKPFPQKLLRTKTGFGYYIDLEA